VSVIPLPPWARQLAALARQRRHSDREPARLAPHGPTLALSKGIDLTTIARRLGDNEVTILRTYSHHVPSADEKAADVLAGVFADRPLTNEPV